MSESIPAISWEENTLMHKLALILISAISLASSSAFAASYQQTGGTIIDPIESRFGGNHSYSGNNLEPDADLTSADLNGAILNGAILNGANLTGANLTVADLNGAILLGADLTGADLTDAFLIGANLSFAEMFNADLSNAILFNATGLGDSFGAALYDANTDFTGTGFDPVAAGWTLVPEPGTVLLMGLGLAGLASRRR